MRKGDKFYKVEALVSKSDVDLKDSKIMRECKSKSSVIFNALENNGIKCYDVSIHSASARICPEHITLDVSGNGEATVRNGFKRHEIEYPVDNKGEDVCWKCRKRKVKHPGNPCDYCCPITTKDNKGEDVCWKCRKRKVKHPGNPCDYCCPITTKDNKEELNAEKLLNIAVKDRTQGQHFALIKYYGGVREYLLSMGSFKDVPINDSEDLKNAHHKNCSLQNYGVEEGVCNCEDLQDFESEDGDKNDKI